MTHYNIDYDKIADETEKRAKAMKDIKEYLGIAQFKKIVKAVHKEQAMTRKNFLIQLSMFVGIEGYPATVWADELGLPPDLELVVNNSAKTDNNSAEIACNAPPLG